MRYNRVKDSLLHGNAAVGPGASLGSPLAAEVLALAGFDFVIVDDQHGIWQPESMMAAFRYIWAAGAVPMGRVLQNTFGHIGAMLDRGALGIIVPMVNTVEDAMAAAYATRYPPHGGRSAGPYGCLWYGADYRRIANDEIFLAVQIESIQAVERAEQIMAVEGVDGCWIGPGDLANSMGIDLNAPADREVHLAAIMRVLDACRKTGKVPGMWCYGPADQWIQRGFRFVTPGGDLGFLQEKAQEILKPISR